MEIGERNLENMQGSADATHPQSRSQDGCKELCNVQLSTVEHVKQRTQLLKKVGAFSRSVIFDGLKSSNLDPNHKELYWAHCQIVRGSGELGKSQPKKIGTRQSLGPIQVIIFDGAQIYTVLT